MVDHKNNEEYFSTSEAAKYLKLSKSTLDRDRVSDEPKIKFYKLPSIAGSRPIVRYKKSDLDDFVLNSEK